MSTLLELIDQLVDVNLDGYIAAGSQAEQAHAEEAERIHKQIDAQVAEPEGRSA